MTRSGLRALFLSAGLAGALTLPAAGAAAAGTLYADLGGQAGITRIVHELFANATADPRIAHDFENINLDWLRPRVVLQICALTGGPCKYTGRDMRAAHKGLHLATFDFNAFAEDLQIAMDRAGVPFSTQNRLLAILAPMHRDIVTR